MAKKKAEKSTEKVVSEHPGTENLVPVRTKEEARERGRKGGLKSAEVRRQKKTMREMAKGIMETTVSEQMGNVRETLARMGLEENDMTYQAAVVVRLIQKAMVEGDTSAIRVLGELTGELNRFGYVEVDDPDVIEMQYPTILIPENGRDAPKENVLGPQAGPQTMFMASSADIVAGEWIDVIRFRDWLKNELQIRAFNALKTNRKVPFTDGGIGLIEGVMDSTLKDGQDIGGIAPTEYDDDDNPIYGYTVTVPKASDLTEAERKSRKLTGCKWSARLAGAIHAVEISGNLTF